MVAQKPATQRAWPSPALQEAEQGLPSPYAITMRQFDYLRGLAKKHAGIYLAEHKQNMVQRRVSRRLMKLGMDGFASYCDYLESPSGATEIEHLINVLTTNKTEFFRESHHFEHLAKTVVPHLELRPDKRIRIWSAGCSSGQEPLTIAITMLSAIQDIDSYDAKVLATDIDTDTLARAMSGSYSADDMEDLPHGMANACFRPDFSHPGHFKVLPTIQRLVTYRHLNLHDNWPMRGPFDVIFCRNVVIYFDKPTQCRLFDRFADILAPNGYLYIGHSESLYKVSERFQFEGQSVYKKIA